MISEEEIKELVTESYEKGADDALLCLVEALDEMKVQGLETLEVDELIEHINTYLRGQNNDHK